MKNERKEAKKRVFCIFIVVTSWLKYLILNKKIMNKMLALFLFQHEPSLLADFVKINQYTEIVLNNILFKKSTHSHWYFRSSQHIKKIPFSCKQQHKDLRRRNLRQINNNVVVKLVTFCCYHYSLINMRVSLFQKIQFNYHQQSSEVIFKHLNSSFNSQQSLMYLTKEKKNKFE